MALNLNTDHPLYGNIVELFGIDPATGTLASVKTARTFSPQTGASYPTTAGTYGKSAKTAPTGDWANIGGIPFSPSVELPNLPMTMFVVVNNSSLSSGATPYSLLSSTQARSPTIGFTAGGLARVFGQYDTLAGVGTTGTTVVTGAGTGSGRAHSFAVTNSLTDHKLYVDGAQEGPAGTRYDARTAIYSCLGGLPGFNAVGAEFVWVVWFDRELTPSEIADLHSSVAPNNVIGLLEGAGAGGSPTVDSVTVLPATPQVTGGTTQQFTATVAGTNNPGQGVTWSFSPNTSGASINSSGVFTAPAATASQQTFTITATSSVDNTKSGSTTATVPATGAPPVTYTGVSVTPSTANVVGLATQQFSANVSGTGAFSTTVTWSVDGTGNGTINSSGLYTAPAAGVSARNVVIRATAANGTTAGTAAVTVPAATGAGSFVTEAMVNNTGQVLSNTSVRWSWFPGGRIGAFSGITPVEGVGTTNAQGQLTATGLATGAGLLIAAQWINGATDDVVFYQAGTVS